MVHNYHKPLIPNSIYHLFNRAIGEERLFITDENYRFFLMKLKHHTNEVCKLYAYSLMPNHFHFLVKIEHENDIIKYFEVIKKVKFDCKIHLLSDFIMERFSNFLNSYTKAFNKVYIRRGALFLDYIKRSQATTNQDITTFIFYVHKNAVHHGLTNNIGTWQFYGYNALVGNGITNLLRSEVISFFGSIYNFIKFHQQPVTLKINIDDV